MKITKTIYIHQVQYSWETSPDYSVYSFKAEDTDYQTYVCSQEVEIEIPDDFDPTAQKIAALEEQKKKINDEFLAKLFEINERITKLQALEFTA